MPVQTGRLVLFRQHMADVPDVDVKLQFLAIFHYFLLFRFVELEMCNFTVVKK